MKLMSEREDTERGSIVIRIGCLISWNALSLLNRSCISLSMKIVLSSWCTVSRKQLELRRMHRLVFQRVLEPSTHQYHLTSAFNTSEIAPVPDWSKSRAVLPLQSFISGSAFAVIRKWAMSPLPRCPVAPQWAWWDQAVAPAKYS